MKMAECALFVLQRSIIQLKYSKCGVCLNVYMYIRRDNGEKMARTDYRYTCVVHDLLIFLFLENAFISFIQCTMVFVFYVPRMIAANYLKGRTGRNISLYIYIYIYLYMYVYIISFCLVQLHEICLYLTIGYFGKM